jgi:hypothetical protein|tara:strand:- start:1449 stop:2711 length:1263 start_codon:yes stop_codon:yes gene_type:complete
MGDLKAIGSEKLTGQDKIKRIMEIARYGESTQNKEYHSSTNSFTKRAANGVTYAIVHEKDGYYVKSGLNESKLDYVDGLSNKRKNRYRSYSAALKRVNLMLKPINEQYNNGRGDSMYEQTDEEKVVIKTPAAPAAAPTPPAAPAAPAAAPTPPAAPAAPAATPPPAPMGDEDMDVDVDMDMGDEDMDVDVDMDMGDDMGGEEGFDGEEQTPTVKSIQKLTGKLGQKMREYEDDMDSDVIKYVLNSVIAAVDLDELDDEDRDDIISRLEPELEDEYGMDDELDVDADMGDDMGDEDIDVDIDMEDEEDMGDAFDDMGLEESLKRRVNGTLKKYFKETSKEKGRRLFNNSAKKSFIKEQIAKSYSKPIPVVLSETIEQELKVKEVLNANKNIKFKEKTKSGTLVFEGNVKRLGVTKSGEILR